MTCVAVVFFLEWAASVIVPFVFALFLVAVSWPLFRWLTRKAPHALAAIACALAFLGLVVACGWGLFLSVEYVAAQNQFSDYRERFVELHGQFLEAGKKIGLSEEQMSAGSTRDALLDAVKPLQSFLVGGTLTVAFLALGLVEVRDYERRTKAHFPSRSSQVAEVFERIARNFQRYVLVRTGIGLLTGVLVAAGAWLIGLDLAPIWGLINFLLNYVPTLGSILGVIPPTLFALVQFDRLEMVLLVFAIVGGIQLLMGNYIDPLVQGRYLQLSPVVILLAVTFWSFVWGIAGALLAVPLTLLIALVLREFPSSRFLSALLLAPEDAADTTRSTKSE